MTSGETRRRSGCGDQFRPTGAPRGAGCTVAARSLSLT